MMPCAAAGPANVHAMRDCTPARPGVPSPFCRLPEVIHFGKSGHNHTLAPRWCVGLLGPLPRPERSAHRAGMRESTDAVCSRMLPEGRRVPGLAGIPDADSLPCASHETLSAAQMRARKDCVRSRRLTPAPTSLSSAAARRPDVAAHLHQREAASFRRRAGIKHASCRAFSRCAAAGDQRHFFIASRPAIAHWLSWFRPSQGHADGAHDCSP